MHYTSHYNSPIGKILIASDEKGVIGLWFEGQKHFAHNLDKQNKEKDLPIFGDVKKWLDVYFSGKNPDFTPALNPKGTDFQIAVWEILKSIPYGKVTTYNEIAKKIAQQKGINKMSAQAVGYAVGHNPISIIVPCHRVIGSDGSLTGYAGGLERKQKLLQLEKKIYNFC